MQCSTWKMNCRFAARLAIAAAVVVLMLTGTRLFAAEEPATARGESGTTATPSANSRTKETHIDRIKAQLAQLTAEHHHLRDNREALARSIVDKCGLSPENVKPVMLELERERFTLRTTLLTKPLHIRFLTEKVEAITAEAKERAKSDIVAAALEKVIATRSNLLEELRKRMAVGTISATDVSKAEADLAEAQVRLALRREELAKAGGDGDLDRLNRELRELSISQFLEQARLHELDSKLKELQAVLNVVISYDDTNERIAGLSREIERLEQYLLSAAVELPSK
jgi:hypothetical protein